MAKLFFVPIEPIEERYSTQWQKWFNDNFLDSDNCFENRIVINPEPITKTINEGQFLDVIGTNHYKTQQLLILLEYIQSGVVENGDIIFFMDYWFPGVEMLAYIRDGISADIKIVGCLHAGTWDQHDFLSQQGMGTWGEHVENAWFEIADLLFVATEFHKQLICSYRKVKSNKIKVTGFPIYAKDLPQKNCVPFLKQPSYNVVFPHRLAPEKSPETFDLMEEIRSTHQSINPESTSLNFFKTKDVWTTKEDYYKQLSASTFAVSFALQETWGIAMQEAVLCGCIPIVPDRLSYSEMYLDYFKYTPSLAKSKRTRTKQDADTVVKTIEVLLVHPQKTIMNWYAQKYLIQSKGEAAINSMMQHILWELNS